MIDFDDVLPHVGEYGKYQILMLALLAPLANIPCGFTYLSIVFVSATPDHWCRVPQLEALSLSPDLIKNLSIPMEDRYGLIQPSNCKMYDRNYTQIAMELSMGYQLSPNENDSLVDCKYGWSYDKSTYESTLVTEMDVVCGNRWMQSMAESSFFIGTITGSIVFGSVGNRYGRKPTFYFLLCFNILCGLAAAFPPNYLAYIIYRGLFGMTSIVMFQIPFIQAMEMMSPMKRSVSGMFISTMFPFSILLLAGIAALLRNWFYISLATSAPMAIFLLLWYFVPESPRWLLTRNRVSEAEAIVQKIARINKKKIPPNFLTDFMRKGSIKGEHRISSELAIVQMLKYPNIRKKFFTISFAWLVNAIVYVGLMLGATMFGVNDFLSVTISALMELPGVVVAWWLMDVFGRRWVIFTSMVLGGVSCFCAGFTPPNFPWTTLILANVGKLGISASFSVIYVFGSELFPTVLRTLALATASLVGSVGAIAAPHILYLGTLYGKVIPVIILGVLSVSGGISTLFLPETLNENLPETIEEGEEFGKGDKFWKCPWSENKKKSRSASIVSTTQPDYKMHGVINLGKF